MFASSLADSILAGWVGGAESSAGKLGDIPLLPPSGTPIGPPPIPPGLPAAAAGAAPDPELEFPGLERAVQSLLDKQLVSPADFYAVSTEARRQAFTISGDLTESTISKIRERIAADLEGPSSRATFTESIREQFDSLPISDSHLEHVYRNAANEAYSQGMDHVLENPLVVDAFPYRAYYATHDTRARSRHRQLEKLGLNGTNIFHKDDPTWRRFKPPWDWNCRCGWAPISIRDAARLGVREAIEWLETGIEPMHVWVAPPPFGPSPSWDLYHVSA